MAVCSGFNTVATKEKGANMLDNFQVAHRGKRGGKRHGRKTRK